MGWLVASWSALTGSVRHHETNQGARQRPRASQKIQSGSAQIAKRPGWHAERRNAERVTSSKRSSNARATTVRQD